jgi:hypothetical protein
MSSCYPAVHCADTRGLVPMLAKGRDHAEIPENAIRIRLARSRAAYVHNLRSDGAGAEAVSR